MAQIPDERDITKTQLWGRIDTAIETIATVGRNTNDNMNAVVSALQRNNEMALAEFKATLKSGLADMMEYVNGKIKFVERLNSEGFTKTVAQNNRNKQELDERLKLVSQNLDESMQKLIQDNYNQLAEAIQVYVDKVNTYKKESVATMNTLQTELGGKIGEVKALFTEMKQKFKKITEQLQ